MYKGDKAKAKGWHDVGASKVDNSPAALHAKIQIREKALEHVSPAHVLDAFCGSDRQMYEAVWKNAASWVGCDGRPWKPGEPARFVADNRHLLRALDLSQFNVFDFDAYGSPWEQMVILAARRKWAPGERGAVVVTDGANLQMRVGGVPHALAQMVGMEKPQGIPSIKVAHDLQGLALRAWVTKAGVRLVRMFVANGGHGSGGKTRGDMLYECICFEGVES